MGVVGVECSLWWGAMEYDVLMVARLLVLSVGLREPKTGLDGGEAGGDD